MVNAQTGDTAVEAQNATRLDRRPNAFQWIFFIPASPFNTQIITLTCGQGIELSFYFIT
jgi:hypothetical protein